MFIKLIGRPGRRSLPTLNYSTSSGGGDGGGSSLLASRGFELETAEPAPPAAAVASTDGDDATCARIVRSTWAANS